MKNLEGKVAAITGASSGIGRAIAIELARRGCHLAICSSRNVEGLQETADEAAAFGVEVSTEKLDVSNREKVYAWADQAASFHGKVNLIFNNAGVGIASTVEGFDYEDFEWLMNINFWGVVYGTKAFLPHLKAAGEGHVINISSIFGLMAVPTQSAYNASKFAVRGFTDCLREELDIMNCGVSATTVHPGGIRTNIARAARAKENIRAVGLDPETFSQKMDNAFMTDADKAAQKIIHAVQENKRRVMVGPDAYLVDCLTRLMPGAYQLLTNRAMKVLLK